MDMVKNVFPIFPIRDEAELVQKLSDSTLHLIHCTVSIVPIKKLVTAYDIMQLNLEIYKKFSEFKHEFPWDITTLSDLSKIRRELVVYHRSDFDPVVKLDRYNTQMSFLLRLASLRKNIDLA
jgi:hypothetical protein